LKFPLEDSKSTTVHPLADLLSVLRQAAQAKQMKAKTYNLCISSLNKRRAHKVINMARVTAGPEETRRFY
jgi:hypothetical protein